MRQTKKPSLKRKGSGQIYLDLLLSAPPPCFSDNKENILLYREILHKFIIKEKTLDCEGFFIDLSSDYLAAFSDSTEAAL